MQTHSPAEHHNPDPFGHRVRRPPTTRAQRIWDAAIDVFGLPFNLLRLAKYNRWVALGFCALGCLSVSYTTTLAACVGVAIATWLLDGLATRRSTDPIAFTVKFTFGLAIATSLAAYALAGAAQGITTFFLTTLVINAASNEKEALAQALYD